MAKLYRMGRFTGSNGIAANSLSVVDGDLLGKSGGYIVKATDAIAPIGIMTGNKTFASDNQTVAKARVEYVEFDDYTEIRLAITGGTITQADEGKTYNLVAAGTSVDGATEGTGTQLRMTKFISATDSVFELVR